MLRYNDPFDVSKETVISKKDNKLIIEGISVIASLGLKGCKQLSVQTDHYIPEEIFELGLVDEFKDLCGISQNTFNFIYNDLKDILKEKHSINSCNFYDSKVARLVNFDKLSNESDIKAAERSYDESIQQKALDHASYCWLGALKTNVSIPSRLITIPRELPELDNLATHIGGGVITKTNIPIYQKGQESIVSLYKSNIVNLLKSYDTFDEGLNGQEDPKEKNHVKMNSNLIKSILNDLGLSKESGEKPDNPIRLSQSFIKEESFKPSVTIAHFMDEKFCIDMVASGILYENDERLLSYDDQNLNNIDNNLRIIDPDRNKIKQGILYELLNGSKKLEDFSKELSLNKTTENQLTFNDIMAYQEEQAKVADPIIYQDYNDKDNKVMSKEQSFLISKYVGENRKGKLGKAFSLINYCFELSTSLRILQDLKRYALLTPKIITTRNSYDNYIFPNLFIINQHLFEEYKHLIESSFKVYDLIIKKGGGYAAAQYANILGVRCNYLMNLNFRQLDSMLSLKTAPQGHFEYREVCQGIYNIIKMVHPSLAKVINIDLNDYKIPIVAAA